MSNDETDMEGVKDPSDEPLKTGLELVPMNNLVQELVNRFHGDDRALILAFDTSANPERSGDWQIFTAGAYVRCLFLQDALENTLRMKWMDLQGYIQKD